MRPTLHIVPAEIWAAAQGGTEYRPEAFAADGFIHCTDGWEELALVAERYYRDEKRELLVLTIDLERVAAPWRYDDLRGVYPHIYGPLNRDAVIAATPAGWGADGFGPVSAGADSA